MNFLLSTQQTGLFGASEVVFHVILRTPSPVISEVHGVPRNMQQLNYTSRGPPLGTHCSNWTSFFVFWFIYLRFYVSQSVICSTRLCLSVLLFPDRWCALSWGAPCEILIFMNLISTAPSPALINRQLEKRCSIGIIFRLILSRYQ